MRQSELKSTETAFSFSVLGPSFPCDEETETDHKNNLSELFVTSNKVIYVLKLPLTLRYVFEKGHYLKGTNIIFSFDI
jgi:hypothetical protein